MAEATAEKSSSLAEQYFVKEKEEKTATSTKPLEVEEVEVPKEMASQEAVAEKTVEAATAAASLVNEESIELAPAAEESAELDSDSSEGSIDATTEQSSEKTDEPEAAEETPEVKLETAPADFRFPTTNQTRHCFTRYVEYHRCIAAKGEGAPECDKFAKYYRSLCPGEWDLIL